MTNDEAIAWCMEQGALVRFGVEENGDSKDGPVGVLVMVHEMTPLHTDAWAPTLAAAVEQLRLKIE